MSIDVCEGSVSGTVAYACRKRVPRVAMALNDGVVMPTASGPMASARVVSSVTSSIDGRGEAGGCAECEQPAASDRDAIRPRAEGRRTTCGTCLRRAICLLFFALYLDRFNSPPRRMIGEGIVAQRSVHRSKFVPQDTRPAPTSAGDKSGGFSVSTTNEMDSSETVSWNILHLLPTASLS